MKLDNLGPLNIKDSLKIEDNIHNIFKSGQGAGRSGSFFFFSNDNNFIIKTMRGTEKEILFNMLHDLINHFTQNQSLMAKIYSVYTIKTNVFDSVDILVM